MFHIRNDRTLADSIVSFSNEMLKLLNFTSSVYSKNISNDRKPIT